MGGLLRTPLVPAPTMGQPGMLMGPWPVRSHHQQRRAHCPVLVIVFIRLGGCNRPALLTSPGDEREATNSFAELLRYLISSNCSWGDRGKEQDSAVDGGKGKTVVEMGRKKGLEGTGGNHWDGVGADTKK